ncbi:MAG: NAD-dependent epimerase/dehydratase family protein [Woeseiaceae bacterium]|nr:NAD-dependent epimerase/dehydratase family protein [Woeseiaceae bacterium]
MKNNRRDFIKAGLLGGVAAATYPTLSHGSSHEGEADNTLSGSLDILVLGGTGFIGPHMVREALRKGHSVTLFNRGRTNNTLFPDLETIKGDRDGGLDGLEGRKWDVVIDNSGYVPRHVKDSARLLSDNTSYYLYISTVAVYKDFKQANHEDSPLATIEDETVEEVTGETYGPLKALCEQKARQEIGDDRYCVLRPTYIAGPGDHTDRFSYWVIRAAKGGAMLWPGSPNHVVQVVDVRDLANFTIRCVEQLITGVYNMVNPEGAYNMGMLLADAQAVTATEVDPVWVDEAFIEEHTVRANGGLPVWHPQTGPDAANFGTSGARARAAGMHSRPERETARDLWRWWNTLPAERTAKPRAGLTAEREAELISLWREKNA